MSQRDINEEAAYSEIADKDFKKRIYDDCDKEDRINVRPLMDIVKNNCEDLLKEEFTKKRIAIAEDRILAGRIYKFLDMYGVREPSNLTPSESLFPHWNGPDSTMLDGFANALIYQSKLFYPHSEWGSGCYKPYTSIEGKTEHDELLKLINKRLHK